MAKERENANRSVSEILTGNGRGAPQGSLLEAALKDNPQLARRLKDSGRTLSAAQQQLFADLVLAAKDKFGARSRESKKLFRPGDDLKKRLDEFLASNPSIEQNRFFEVAIDRLLSEFGA